MLRYSTAARVGEGAARRILEAAAALRRDWWKDPLGLDRTGDRTLEGRSALFHSGGIPDADDLFMAFADAVFILERLGAWAREERLKWRFTMHDDDWGALDPSGPDPVLRRALDKWAGRVRAERLPKGRYAVSEERRAGLLARHADRPRPPTPPLPRA
jgi:hypothetical protein